MLQISLPSLYSFPVSVTLLLLSRFSRVNSVRPHRWQPTRLPCPWDSPGKNTGVGCHFLLQWIKVKSEGEVTQSCPTLSDPMDCSLPGSSIHGIFQARVLEWGAIAFSVQCYLRSLLSIFSIFIRFLEWFSSLSYQPVLVINLLFSKCTLFCPTLWCWNWIW